MRGGRAAELAEDTERRPIAKCCADLSGLSAKTNPSNALWCQMIDLVMDRGRRKVWPLECRDPKQGASGRTRGIRILTATEDGQLNYG